MQQTVVIINKLGLHARASAKLVKTASRFGSQIELSRTNDAEKKVNAKSIMGVMMLAASKGTEILLDANGDDAAEAIKALVQLIADRFGEEE